MDRIELIKTVAATFENNPEAKAYHVTKDAQCFLLERDAVDHGKHLGPHASGVELITRESALDFDPNEEKTKEQHKREREAKVAAAKQATEDAKLKKIVGEVLLDAVKNAELITSEPAATSTGGTESGTDAADGGASDGGGSGNAEAAPRTDAPAKAAPNVAENLAAKAAPKKAAPKKATKKAAKKTAKKK